MFEKIKILFKPAFEKETSEKGGVWLLPLVLIGVAGIFVGTGALDLGPEARELLLALIVIVVKAMLGIAQYLAELSVNLFQTVLRLMINEPSNMFTITKNKVFYDAWIIAQGWANMLIVIALIAVAIITILRLSGYSTKKLLAGLIIVALLVNFSPVVVGLMIDASNFMMKAFLGKDAGGIFTSDLFHHINTMQNKTVKMIDLNAEGDEYINVAQAYIGLAALVSVSYLILALALLYFSLFLIQRYIMLAALFIFSPLAFVLRVFPLSQAKMLWDKWWENLLKWCFMGVFAAFFLKLSIDMIGALEKVEDPLKNIPNLVFYLLVSMGFMWLGLKITKRAGGPVAGFVMGAAKGLALGAATAGLYTAWKGAKGLGKATGATNVLQGAKGRVVRGMERLGLVTRGTAARMMAKTYEPTKEQKDAINNATDQDLVTRAQSTAYTQAGQREKVLATQRLFREGNGHLLGDTEKQKKALEYAEKYSPAASSENREMWEKAAQKNADLAVYDKERMGALERRFPQAKEDSIEEIKKNNAIGFGESKSAYETRIKGIKDTKDKEHKERIEGMARRDAYAKMDKTTINQESEQDTIAMIENEIKDKKAGKITHYKASTTARMEKAAREGFAYKINATDEERGEMLGEGQERFGSNGIKYAIESNHNYAQYDKKAVDYAEEEIFKELSTNPNNALTATAFLRAQAKTQAKDRATANEATRVNPGRIRDKLSVGAIDMNLIKNIDSKTIENSDRGGNGLSEEKKKAFEKLLPKINNELSPIIAKGAAATKEEKALRVILTRNRRAIETLLRP